MAMPPAHEESISRGDFHRLLSSLLAFDRAVVEFYMQFYGMPPHQQMAMRRQNRRLHSLVWESYSGQAKSPWWAVQHRDIESGA